MFKKHCKKCNQKMKKSDAFYLQGIRLCKECYNTFLTNPHRKLPSVSKTKVNGKSKTSSTTLSTNTRDEIDGKKTKHITIKQKLKAKIKKIEQKKEEKERRKSTQNPKISTKNVEKSETKERKETHVTPSNAIAVPDKSKVKIIRIIMKDPSETEASEIPKVPESNSKKGARGEPTPAQTGGNPSGTEPGRIGEKETVLDDFSPKTAANDSKTAEDLFPQPSTACSAGDGKRIPPVPAETNGNGSNAETGSKTESRRQLSKSKEREEPARTVAVAPQIAAGEDSSKGADPKSGRRRRYLRAANKPKAGPEKNPQDEESSRMGVETVGITNLRKKSYSRTAKIAKEKSRKSSAEIEASASKHFERDKKNLYAIMKYEKIIARQKQTILVRESEITRLIAERDRARADNVRTDTDCKLRMEGQCVHEIILKNEREDNEKKIVDLKVKVADYMNSVNELQLFIDRHRDKLGSFDS